MKRAIRLKAALVLVSIPVRLALDQATAARTALDLDNMAVIRRCRL